jgi:hypothetical protein
MVVPGKIKNALFLVVFLFFYIPFVKNYGVALIREDAVDFPSFYYGAKLAFIEDASPYVQKNLQRVFRDYTGNNGDYFPYLYPPPSLVFFLPFAQFPYEQARLGMLALNHFLVLFFIYAFLFKVMRAKPGGIFSIIFIIYFLLFAPLQVTIDNGQVNLVILVLICLAWWFEKDEKSPLWSALPLSLAILLKLYPALLLIPLFFAKRYKTVGLTILLTLIISIIVTPFLPDGAWQTWYANVGSKGYAQSVLNLFTDAPANQSIFGLLTRAFFGKNVRFAPIWVVPGWFSKFAPYVLSGSVALLSLMASFVLSRSKTERASALDMNISLWLLVSFLVAPISWDHHLVFIVPALAVLIETLSHTQWKRDTWMFVPTAFAAVALAIPFPYNSPAFREGVKTLLISTSLYLVGLVWLLAVSYSFLATKRFSSQGAP